MLKRAVMEVYASLSVCCQREHLNLAVCKYISLWFNRDLCGKSDSFRVYSHSRAATILMIVSSMKKNLKKNEHSSMSQEGSGCSLLPDSKKDLCSILGSAPLCAEFACLHAMSAWVLSGYCGFLPQSKNI